MLLKDINELIARKKSGEEMSLEPRINSINEFLDREMKRLSENTQDRVDSTDYDELNRVFQTILGNNSDRTLSIGN